jgi:arylsulfatase A-like enzyme
LCQPSRATLLSGRYDQNSGAVDNSAASYQRFVSSGVEGDSVAVWLKNAGYRTGFVGKYMNGYAGSGRIPPGWSYFVGRAGGGLYYDYRLNENGRFVSYGSTSADYSTSVYEGKTLKFLNKPGVTSSPFFLLVAPNAPHVPTQALSSDLAAVPSTVRAPRDAAFARADIGGNRNMLRRRGPLSPAFIMSLDASYRREAAALRAVDRMFLHVYRKLQAAGVADRTYFVFASDNGWMWGDHGIAGGKGREYDQVERDPLVIAGPGIAAGSTIDALVSNADCAPTFAEWAGARHGEVDGRSLAPLFGGGEWPRRSMPANYRFEASAPRAPGWRGCCWRT